MSNTPNPTEEAALTALAAVVRAETLERESANRQREIQGHSPAYTDEIVWPALDTLRSELMKRGYRI